MAVTMVVQFGDGSDASDVAAIELDGTLNVDAEGNEKSQFNPGDEVYFLVHHDPSVRIDRVESTDGMVVAMGTDTREREQQLFYTSTEAQQLSYLPTGALTHNWMPGGSAATAANGFEINGRSVSVDESSLPCLEKVSYNVTFSVFRLIPPALALAEGETYAIGIVAYIEAVT